MVATIGCSRPKITISALIAPHRQPTSSTPITPKAVISGEPTTIHDARQLARTITAPTERSMPDVRTTNVCAIAMIASSAPLLAAVVATLASRRAEWLGAQLGDTQRN